LIRVKTRIQGFEASWYDSIVTTIISIVTNNALVNKDVHSDMIT
jgi:hypothetical protein